MYLDKFIIAGPPDSGESYQVSASYTFDLKKNGPYEIKFNVMLYCNGLSCKEATDFLNVYANKQDVSLVRSRNTQPNQTVTSQNLNQFNRWVERSAKFEIKSESENKFKVFIKEKYDYDKRDDNNFVCFKSLMSRLDAHRHTRRKLMSGLTTFR